jgi:ABC-2 type transport system permease protein
MSTLTYRLTPAGVLRSEWTKLWSLRSTRYTLGVIVVLILGLGLIIGATYTGDGGGDFADPVATPLIGVQFSTVLIAVLGVLATAGEWSTGMARASFAAVPRRLPVLWSKVAVFGAAVFALALATAFATFSLAQLFLSGTGLTAGLSEEGVVASLFGVAVTLSLAGLFGLGLGALLRSIPAAISTFVGVVLIVPGVAPLLPYAWIKVAVDYTPMYSMLALITTDPPDGLPSKSGAVLTLVCWAAVALAAAAVRLVRRDV